MPLSDVFRASIAKIKHTTVFLDLCQSGFTDDDIKELVDLIRGSAIVKLDLSRNILTAESAVYLSQCYQLEEIILDQNGLDDEGAVCFAQNAQNEKSHLVILDLSQNGVTDVGAKALLSLLERRPFKLLLDNNSRISPEVLGRIMGKSRLRVEVEFSKPRSPFSNYPVLLSPKSGMPMPGPSRNKRHAAWDKRENPPSVIPEST